MSAILRQNQKKKQTEASPSFLYLNCHPPLSKLKVINFFHELKTRKTIYVLSPVFSTVFFLRNLLSETLRFFFGFCLKIADIRGCNSYCLSLHTLFFIILARSEGVKKTHIYGLIYLRMVMKFYKKYITTDGSSSKTHICNMAR